MDSGPLSVAGLVISGLSKNLTTNSSEIPLNPPLQKGDFCSFSIKFPPLLKGVRGDFVLPAGFCLSFPLTSTESTIRLIEGLRIADCGLRIADLILETPMLESSHSQVPSSLHLYFSLTDWGENKWPKRNRRKKRGNDMTV